MRFPGTPGTPGTLARTFLGRVIRASFLASTLALVACGGPAREAVAPESDPWAGYTGKYTAPSADGRKSDKSDAPVKREAKAEKPSKGESEKAAKSESTEPSDSPAASASSGASAAKKPSSKGMIQGESVSLIGPDALGEASKSALKGKVVSSKLMVGAQYETVQVQLKGVGVQIFRPAQSPNPNGPTISAPKARNGELSKTESGWYDEEADVLVVVNSGKKAGSQKALGAILKR